MHTALQHTTLPGRMGQRRQKKALRACEGGRLLETVGVYLQSREGPREVELCKVGTCLVELCRVELCKEEPRKVELCKVKLCKKEPHKVELCQVELCQVELCQVELCQVELCQVELCQVEL